MGWAIRWEPSAVNKHSFVRKAVNSCSSTSRGYTIHSVTHKRFIEVFTDWSWISNLCTLYFWRRNRHIIKYICRWQIRHVKLSCEAKQKFERSSGEQNELPISSQKMRGCRRFQWFSSDSWKQLLRVRVYKKLQDNNKEDWTGKLTITIINW